MTRRRELVIEVKRDLEGKVYSAIADKNHPDRLRRGGDFGAVVIDRERGRFPSFDSVINRAQSIAALTGIEYAEDLTWPCKADQGYSDCHCPKCAAKVDARGRR